MRRTSVLPTGQNLGFGGIYFHQNRSNHGGPQKVTGDFLGLAAKERYEHLTRLTELYK